MTESRPTFTAEHVAEGTAETGSAMLGHLSGVTIDCRNPARLAMFWGSLLGLDAEEPLPGWRRLGRRGQQVPVINFQPVPEPKRGKNRVHLDLTVGSIDDAVALVTTLGGRFTGERHDYAEGVVIVMEDPENNEFCLTEYYGE